MGDWLHTTTELLWRQAIIVIPMIVIVTAITRWIPCRPATRHLLWTTIIAWLCLSPLLPHSGLISYPSVIDRSVPLTKKESPSADRVPASAVLDESLADKNKIVDLKQFASRQGAPTHGMVSSAREMGLTCIVTSDNTTDIDKEKTVESTKSIVARPVPDTLDSLAQAVGVGGPLSPHVTVPIRKLRNDNKSTSSHNSKSDYSKYFASNHQKKHLLADEILRQPSTSQLSTWFDECLRPLSRTAREPILAKEPVWLVEENISPELTITDSALYAETLPILNQDKQASDWLNTLTIQQSWVSLRAGIQPWIAGLANLGRSLATLPPIPTAIWLGGIFIVLAIYMWSIIRFQRVLRRVRPASIKLNGMVSLVADRMGLVKIPNVHFVDDCISPMICCGRRPKLIFPTGLWSQLDDGGRQAVVSHELAHLRRKDHWIIWAEMCAGVLYWWHPLVWWVRHRLHMEAEFSCDAWVTALWPEGRKDYAQALLLTKQYVNNPNFRENTGSIGIISGRAQRFARRLTMVMTQRTAPRLSASGIILALSLGIVGWAATPAQSCPKKEGWGKSSAKVVGVG